MRSFVVYITGSVGSQISTETVTRRHRHQSQRAGAGDAHETSAMAVTKSTSVTTESSLSIWQHFVVALRSVAYFCLVACPAGMI